ncbi:MAG: VacB/RNase II family 3'-5' exoribonuclease [Planctomycetota bacterium]|nr:MAG: VacB/RNase II family 3'-5' exoribonuclease [Planctomycetota bacterium]
MAPHPAAGASLIGAIVGAMAKRSSRRNPNPRDRRQESQRPNPRSSGPGPQGKRGPRQSGRGGGQGISVSVDEQAVAEALAEAPGLVTASQLAELMGLTGDAPKGVSRALISLKETGKALELRPGKWASPGTGGEFPVVVETGATAEELCARFDDQRLLPIPKPHRMGARPGDTALAVVGDDGLALLTRLVSRGGRRLVGTLNFQYGRVTVVPDRRREGSLPVLRDEGEVLDRYRAGDRVVAMVVDDEHHGFAAVLERILDASDPEVADFEQVCLVHDLPGDFAPAVLAAAEALEADFDPAQRRDCRNDLVFTIDPDTAKDFDDAICLERLENGGWRLAVHIADVSHFVRPNSLIDAEAQFRGTSCYLVNRVIPMLPEHLSNGLCSLVPLEDRYVLSAFIDLDRRGQVRKVDLAEAIINSRQRLDYGQALAIIEGRDPGIELAEGIAESVQQSHELAQLLRRNREAKGALNLYGQEAAFTLDVEGNPIEVVQETSDVAHQLIEEFMLLANREVAAWLSDRVPAVVYRVHGEPDESRLAFFQELVTGYGLPPMAVTDRPSLQRVLKRLEKEPPASRLVLNFLLLRCFQKAQYSTDESLGHYALAFSHYCHFTSPIRRYPDLIDHRLVKFALGLDAYRDSETRPDYLEALAKRSSFLERRAQDAERELHAIKAARYLHTRLGDEFQGVVLSASGAGLHVHLVEVGMEALLPLREMGDDFYVFSRERLALIGRSTGRVLGVGTELQVQVVAVDIPRSDVTLAPAGGLRPARPKRRD